jgi:hypothetical protein
MYSTVLHEWKTGVTEDVLLYLFKALNWKEISYSSVQTVLASLSFKLLRCTWAVPYFVIIKAGLIHWWNNIILRISKHNTTKYLSEREEIQNTELHREKINYMQGDRKITQYTLKYLSFVAFFYNVIGLMNIVLTFRLFQSASFPHVALFHKCSQCSLLTITWRNFLA